MVQRFLQVDIVGVLKQYIKYFSTLFLVQKFLKIFINKRMVYKRRDIFIMILQLNNILLFTVHYFHIQIIFIYF